MLFGILFWINGGLAKLKIIVEDGSDVKFYNQKEGS